MCRSIKHKQLRRPEQSPSDAELGRQLYIRGLGQHRAVREEDSWYDALAPVRLFHTFESIIFGVLTIGASVPADDSSVDDLMQKVTWATLEFSSGSLKSVLARSRPMSWRHQSGAAR